MDAQTDTTLLGRHAQKLVRFCAAAPYPDHRAPAPAPDGITTPYTANDFNLAAIAHGWPILIDPLCRFSEGKLHSVMALWQQMTADNSIPRRQDMTARLLQPYIPQLSIFERVPGEDGTVRFRARLMGTNMVQFTAEMTGHFLDDMIGPDYLPRWISTGQTILGHGAPLRILHRGDSFNKKFVVGEGFAAPLLTTDGRADLIMTVFNFEGFDSWEVVAARTLAQLGLPATKSTKR